MGYEQLLPIGLSLLGALGGSQKNKTSQTTTNTLDPAYGPLQAALLKQTMARLGQTPALTQGEIAGGIGNINNTYRTIQQSIGNRAAQSGQSGGAGEQYALNNADISRGGDIGQFRAVTVPGIERDLQQQNFANAMGVLGTGRYGSTTTGTGGGGAGGALGGLGGMLGYLYGQGAIGGGGGGSNNVRGSGNAPLFSAGGGIDWASLFKQYSPSSGNSYFGTSGMKW